MYLLLFLIVTLLLYIIQKMYCKASDHDLLYFISNPKIKKKKSHSIQRKFMYSFNLIKLILIYLHRYFEVTKYTC